MSDSNERTHDDDSVARLTKTKAAAKGIALVEGASLLLSASWQLLYRFGGSSRRTEPFLMASSVLSLVLTLAMVWVLSNFAKARRGTEAASFAVYAWIGSIALATLSVSQHLLSFVGSGAEVYRALTAAFLVVGPVFAVSEWLALTKTTAVSPARVNAWIAVRVALSLAGAASLAGLGDPFSLLPEALGSALQLVLWWLLDAAVVLVAFRISQGQVIGSEGVVEPVAGFVDVALQRSDANRDLLVGGLWFGGGVLVTAISYASAEGGGRFVVTTGAIVYGLFRLGRGVLRKLG